MPARSSASGCAAPPERVAVLPQREHGSVSTCNMDFVEIRVRANNHPHSERSGRRELGGDTVAWTDGQTRDEVPTVRHGGVHSIVTGIVFLQCRVESMAVGMAEAGAT
ncbi:hypothetical protein Vretifemale_19084 [Volvox reticuliferus]|uniref:Uncharacterized protein n=1 Tax=Volvox reticuliferus TaxID=1737510 RepID=A0A8J4FY78_9CHLO|nr:hypothetical protein Vretifemale_19084 [Volvox reticuliferus]